MSSGSLGQGLSVALGMAMYAKARKKRYRTFCILGDGEIQEGRYGKQQCVPDFIR